MNIPFIEERILLNRHLTLDSYPLSCMVSNPCSVPLAQFDGVVSDLIPTRAP